MISAVAPPSLRQKFEKSSRYALYSVFLRISMFISSKSSAGTHSKLWKAAAVHCCLDAPTGGAENPQHIKALMTLGCCGLSLGPDNG